jgi:hypothetical protein
LKEIADTKFECLKSPFEITQLLRGHEFVYLDSLLQHDFLQAKEELPHVFKYFEQTFILYITFLKMLPEYIPDVPYTIFSDYFSIWKDLVILMPF